MKRRGRHPDIATPPGVRLVRYYGNRRLYDTKTSNYINREGMFEIFATDRTAKVMCAKTGDDLTANILSQMAGDFGLFEPGTILRAIKRRYQEVTRARRTGLWTT